MPKPKFTFSRRQQWAAKKREENYVAAESTPIPSAEKRRREVQQIEEFIRRHGVTKINIRREQQGGDP